MRILQKKKGRDKEECGLSLQRTHIKDFITWEKHKSARKMW